MRCGTRRKEKWVAEVSALCQRESGLDILNVRFERAQPNDGESQRECHDEDVPRADGR
jgi:hypothetical protein